ncbi:MAG: UDP-3-O-(3-hydroxymyristoyl)glucosamine N-acyltransferase [Paludibacter sp.]|nr:MAG: UDP-3-O-(3-hydroxymyristoyl)glucosamine N-acyltransferase [Paludibacter sp.]
MEFNAQQIADFLKGELVGNPEVKLSGFATLEKAKPNELTFLSNPKYTQFIYKTNAGAVLVNNDFEPEKEIKATLIKVKNAYESLAGLLKLVETYRPKKKGISQQAVIEDSAKTGKDVYIAPFVYIGEGVKIGENVRLDASVYVGDNVTIGNNTEIHAGVKIEKDCVIGKNCILQAGCVIGSDGFGFAPTEDGSYEKIPQIGNVVLEDDVEVGANTTIDRATFGSTTICQGVKLDNLVQVAHNVVIGKNTVMAGQTGVAGSTKIGEQCILGGQVGVAGHLEIADKCSFGAQTGIPSSIKKKGSIMQGYPAIEIGTFRRASIVYKNLPELQKEVYRLKKEIEELKK